MLLAHGGMGLVCQAVLDELLSSTAFVQGSVSPLALPAMPRSDNDGAHSWLEENPLGQQEELKTTQFMEII